MAIIQTVDFCLFENAFRDAGRSNNFSSEGLNLLFEMLESISEETNNDMELDVVELCCEYSESSLREFVGDHAGAEETFLESKQEIDLDYLANYITDNLNTLLKDTEIINTYFSEVNNDNSYSIKDNEIIYNNAESDIIQTMLDQLIDNNYEEFLKLVCDITNDVDYIESIDSVMNDIVTEYLDAEGGIYRISDCQTIVVYQQF